MIKEIQKLTNQALEETKPFDFCVGIVVSENPLRIKVSDKIVVDESFLILSNEVKKIERMFEPSAEYDNVSGYRNSWYTMGRTCGNVRHKHVLNMDIDNKFDWKIDNNAYINVSHSHEYQVKFLGDWLTFNTSSELNKGIDIPTQGLKTDISMNSTPNTLFYNREPSTIHSHKIKKWAKIIIHNELKKDEMVSMLRIANGQMYYVLDRIYTIKDMYEERDDALDDLIGGDWVVTEK